MSWKEMSPARTAASSLLRCQSIPASQTGQRVLYQTTRRCPVMEGPSVAEWRLRQRKDVDGGHEPVHDEGESPVPGLRRSTSCCVAPGKRDQLSRNDRSFLDLLGCFSFRSAF